MGRGPAETSAETVGRASVSVAVHLPVSARAAAMARGTVTSALRHCGLEEIADDVVLVASELVTQAFLYSGDDIFLELEVVDDVLQVAVTGATSTVPAQRQPADDEDRERVLSLLWALTSDRGVEEQLDGRRRAWVRFGVPAPA